jgi:hypothetical protein
MIVKQAKDVARRWVSEEASKIPRFYGAFFVGSVNWMSDETPFPSTSDLDVRVIVEDSQPPGEIRKFRYRDVVLEVSYGSSEQFQSTEKILGDYTIACHLARPSIILDPLGQLTKIQEEVSRDYAKRKWVHKRCENVQDLLLASFQWLNETDPFHDQVFAWLYATGVPNHMVLTADLKNPTVRRMFAASRDVLGRYGYLSLHESVLGILGSEHMSREQVESFLKSCTEVFDVAKDIVKTPFFGASTISDFAGSVAIDGSRELITSGYHREAVFWIAVIHTWCQKALYNDASTEVQQRFMPSYQHLLRDLGVTSFDDLQHRNEQTEELFPEVWKVAEAIIAANPEIMD